jgi:hypothetical protein
MRAAARNVQKTTTGGLRRIHPGFILAFFFTDGPVNGTELVAQAFHLDIGRSRKNNLVIKDITG